MYPRQGLSSRTLLVTLSTPRIALDEAGVLPSQAGGAPDYSDQSPCKDFHHCNERGEGNQGDERRGQGKMAAHLGWMDGSTAAQM
jgi:hypothetical protein